MSKSAPLLAHTAVLLALAFATPARANDSMAEIGVGGLTLVKTNAVVMQSEDLFVSKDRITVDYVFLNTSGADVEALVAFPLPDVTYEPEIRIPGFVDELGFTTTVDGKPLKLDVVQTALLAGRDVTARVTAAGLPVLADWDKFEKAVTAKTPAERKALIAEGLLKNEGDEENPYWLAGWVTRTTVTRTQVFPAGRPVKVSHAYRPLAGGSVGSLLDARHRKEADYAEDIGKTRAKYCVDDAFLKALDAATRAKADALSPETWLSYVLTSGANWKGPIGRFRLVVDKGDPKNLVSFCAEGVKKIAPTRFEVVYPNFTPTQDLNVLIVEPNAAR